MKIRNQTVLTWVTSVAPQLAVLVAIFVAAGLNGAEPSDLQTFGSDERYVAEGVSAVLTQKVGEVTIKLRSATRPEQVAKALAAANGALFIRDRQLPSGLGMYKLHSAGSVGQTVTTEALDSLNRDTDVQYAYPVYANAATGLRHLLNDEIVVRLKVPLDQSEADLLALFKVRFKDTLSARDNIYVVKLTEPKNLNPFQVCHALLQRPEVVWAEPNMTQEGQQCVIPNDSYFGSQWGLLNTGQTQAFADADVDADAAWDSS